MTGPERGLAHALVAALLLVMASLVGTGVVYGRSVTISKVRTFDVRLVHDLLDAAVASDPVDVETIERAFMHLRRSPDLVYLPMALFRDGTCVATNKASLCEQQLDDIRGLADVTDVWQHRPLGRPGWVFVAYHDERRFEFDGWFAMVATPIDQWMRGSIDVDLDVFRRKALWPMAWTFVLGSLIWGVGLLVANGRERRLQTRLDALRDSLNRAEDRVASLTEAPTSRENEEAVERLELLLGELEAQRDNTAELAQSIAAEEGTEPIDHLRRQLADSQAREDALGRDVDEALSLVVEHEQRLLVLKQDHADALAEAKKEAAALRARWQGEAHRSQNRAETLQQSLDAASRDLDRLTSLWTDRLAWKVRAGAEHDVPTASPAKRWQPFTLAMAFIGMEMTLRERAKAWSEDIPFKDLLRRARVPDHERSDYHQLRGARNRWFHEGRPPSPRTARLLMDIADRERFLVPFDE